jgi:hypothetical protein
MDTHGVYKLDLMNEAALAWAVLPLHLVDVCTHVPITANRSLDLTGWLT